MPKELNFGELGWKLWPLNGTSLEKYRGTNIPYENLDTWLSNYYCFDCKVRGRVNRPEIQT